MSQRQNTPVTRYANNAMAELFTSGEVTWWLTSILKTEKKALEEHNKRAVLAGLKPATNKKFDDAASIFLGKSLLCQAVDVYNNYCQEVLQLAVANNPKAIPLKLQPIKKFREQLDRAVKLKTDPAAEILTLFQTRYVVDSAVRNAIHVHLGIDQFPETELVCLCRNILIHKRGVDRKREIPVKLKEIGKNRAFIGAQGFPDGHLPIALDSSGELICDHDTGRWAARLLSQQIFFMDQGFAHRYSLPRVPWIGQSLGRTYAN